jgi:transposase-like protein
MDQKIRRVHSATFKAKVVMEALKEQKTLAELSSQFGVHAMVISKWKKQAVEILAKGYSDKRQLKEKDDSELIQELYRQIGKLKVEVDFLKKKMGIFGA